MQTVHLSSAGHAKRVAVIPIKLVIGPVQSAVQVMVRIFRFPAVLNDYVAFYEGGGIFTNGLSFP
jgi:hypothetical protein